MLRKRVITALVMLPIFLAGLFLTELTGFRLFTAAIIGVAAWEWARFGAWTTPARQYGFVLLVLVSLFASLFFPPAMLLTLGMMFWASASIFVLTWPKGQAVWIDPHFRLFTGWLLLVLAWSALSILYQSRVVNTPDFGGTSLILYCFLVVWTADTGAYFVGRRFGRRKLAPTVSPGKSIEGAYGGLAVVSILPLIASQVYGFGFRAWLTLWIISLLVAAFSISGDLLESLAKRSVGMKDSSQILPGHGGFMDRIDSITAAAPVFGFLLLLSGWVIPGLGSPS